MISKFGKLKTLGLIGLASIVPSGPVFADVLIRTPEDIQNLTIEQVGFGARRTFRLAMVYRTENGRVGLANLACPTRNSCTRLRSTLREALEDGQHVLLNFDSEIPVAQIIDATTAPPVIPADRVVCDESDLQIIHRQGTAFALSLNRDILIPANSNRVAIGNHCSLILKESMGQPRRLAARTLQLRRPSRSLANRDHTGQTVPSICPPGATYVDSSACRHRNGHYAAPQYPLEQLLNEVVGDPTVRQVICDHRRTPETLDEPQDTMGDWVEYLEAGGLAGTNIGEALACTQPIEALLIGGQNELNEALATFGSPVPSQGRSAEEPTFSENSYEYEFFTPSLSDTQTERAI